MSKKLHTVQAPAKTNLWLRVLGKRDDGFHAIETRMVALALSDQLALSWTDKEKVVFSCTDKTLPTGEENLVVKAVRAMENRLDRKFGIKIQLKKEIPVGAGLGGGSSDAAAVIKAINEMGKFGLDQAEMARIGAEIGSDIPFFIYNRPCDVSGRGEIVEPLDGEEIPRLPIVLLKPNFGISAAWAYQNFAKSGELILPPNVPQICPWGKMENDLERPVFMKFPILKHMKTWLLKQPEVHAALLSGSGSTVLAVLRHYDGGQTLVERAISQYGEATWSYCGYTA